MSEDRFRFAEVAHIGNVLEHLARVEASFLQAPVFVRPHLLPLLELQRALVAYLEVLESQR